MKMLSTVAAALLAAAPALSASAVTLDFEGAAGYVNPIEGFYGGGTDSLGQSGPNLGISFSDVAGLSNDALGPYYSNAPSPLTVVFAFDDTAFMNVAAGFVGTLAFAYSSSGAAVNAVNVYSGLNGTGTLLGSLSLLANAQSGCAATPFCNFDDLILPFAGTARSVGFGGGSPNVLYDNIAVTPVPEPETYALMLAGLATIAAVRRRRHNAGT